jgi:plastocyanin
LNYSPAAVTISAGSTVIWDSSLGTGTSSHTLYIDTGTQTACGPNPPSHGYPATVVFPSTGTFHFHCSYHTGCGTSCSACSGGMQGVVVVQ